MTGDIEGANVSSNQVPHVPLTMPAAPAMPPNFNKHANVCIAIGLIILVPYVSLLATGWNSSSCESKVVFSLAFGFFSLICFVIALSLRLYERVKWKPTDGPCSAYFGVVLLVAYILVMAFGWYDMPCGMKLGLTFGVAYPGLFLFFGAIICCRIVNVT